MLTMRESDKPARDAEKAYKKEKNARGTSSKAQKGEALQEPGGIIRYNVVKVSNNRFYKHAENNVEMMVRSGSCTSICSLRNCSHW